MNGYELFIMSCIDGISTVIVAQALLMQKELNKKMIIFCIIITSVIGVIFKTNSLNIYSLIINGISICWMYYMIFRRSIMEILYLYVLTIIIVVGTQLFTIILLSNTVENVQYSFKDGMLVQMLSVIVLTLISRYIPIHIMFDFIVKKNKVFKSITINICVLLYIILVFWHMDINNIIGNIVSITTISLVIIFINFVVLKNGLKNEYEEKQLQMYYKYLLCIEQLIDELRSKQHEFDNHIQALSMISITNTSHEEIINLMKEYVGELKIENDLGDLIKLENKVLAGLLYGKKKQAEKENIKFEIVIKDYILKTRLKDFELVEVVGNLLNNAFETGINENDVKIMLYSIGNNTVIEVKNKHPYISQEKIATFFKEGFSTKALENRGYGLHNLREIVNKYKGEIEVFNEEYDQKNYVVFKIVIESIYSY